MSRIARNAGIAAAGVGGCAFVLAMFVGIVVLGLFLVKFLWAWAIPDLFPGAVKQGLIAREISYYTAFKLAVFVAMLGVMAHIAARGEAKDTRTHSE